MNIREHIELQIERAFETEDLLTAAVENKKAPERVLDDIEGIITAYEIILLCVNKEEG